jgi:hypothetical protein
LKNFCASESLTNQTKNNSTRKKRRVAKRAEVITQPEVLQRLRELEKEQEKKKAGKKATKRQIRNSGNDSNINQRKSFQ